MAGEQQKLYTASNRLARYFGLYTARDLAGRVALDQLQGITGATRVASFDLPPPPQEITDLVAAIVDTSEGGYTAKDLVEKINDLIQRPTSSEGSDAGAPATGPDGGLQQRINRFVEFYGPRGTSITGAENPVSMDEILVNSIINSNPNNPSKDESPHLSVLKVNNVRITPAQKNINAVTIFLNGMPTLELSRAMPYLDIQLLLPGSPISQDGRLQNISLFRYLEGNAEVDPNSGSTRSVLALATKIRNTDSLGGAEPTEQNTTYTNTGMEIFTAPQTLTNGDQSFSDPNRVNPILDKFASFLTLKEFTVEVAPSTGMMSFKTARLNFVLHDRSRLAEIADLIRPDLYARTELMVEYGWIHPEADTTGPAITNYYAELLNAMRCREKYGIVNSSLTFEDGLVNITLELAMRGGSDTASEVISTDDSGAVNQVLRTIRELSESVGTYRRRIFGQTTGPSSVEVRGIQILDAAEDARSNLILDRNLQDQLRQFQRTLSQRGRGPAGSTAARELSATLERLYNSQTGAATEARRTVQDSIRTKLVRLSSGEDPFLRPDALETHQYNARTRSGSVLAQRRDAQGRRDTNTDNRLANELRGIRQECSLAKLLLLFVGEPLAMTHKFDDIQFVFYPFNMGAGFARNINIGSFVVDTRYFYENYSRLRLESLSRSSNMNLRDFLQFVTTTILDDHGAKSYGLFGLFRRVTQDGGGSTTEATVDAVELQNRIERLLANVTPDATFRMPQVDFYMEALPQRIDREGSSTDIATSKTILRIHVFDRQMTAYETQGSLIAAAREEEIRNISGIPFIAGGDGGVVESQTQEANAIIQAASSAGLVEQIPNSNMYRITGGTTVLKEFLRRTMPYVIYGAAGTAIKSANLSSIQDAALSTVNMLRSYQQTQLEPNGEQPGGLPLQIIPTELSVTAYGCPLIDFAQQFFIDFQTGTSVDNIYGVVGISHRISPGEFSSEFRMAPLDAYGTYRSLTERVNNARLALQETDRTDTSTDQALGSTTPSVE